MGDAIFAAIETYERRQDRPWGEGALDAGTGKHSLRWLAGVKACPRWTAITASTSMAAQAGGAVARRRDDRLVVGNWRDPRLLEGERFDVVLADYLLGALDAFDPFGQDQLFPRLRPHVQPGGRVYVVGLEPSRAKTDLPWGQVILELERLRDACILLAGDRCYREYPRAWVSRNLERAGLTVVEERVFPIRYGEGHINSQLGVARRKLERIGRVDAALARELTAALERLEQRASQVAATSGRATFGEDYLVIARAL